MIAPVEYMDWAGKLAKQLVNDGFEVEVLRSKMMDGGLEVRAW